MKTRSMLTAGEVDALLADLERRLAAVGVETQPEVAARVMRLVSDPKAGLRDFANTIKADPALSGRLLRLANSAFFAQRQPVSNLERACVLLGLGRIKSVSMGFYLSRAAATDAGFALSRRVWGESVYRACLASELAHRVSPTLAPEAFIIGLMLDAGVPILARLQGEPARTILEQNLPPARQFRAEFQTLAFTHVDVVAALARRWRLPELLAKPIERHHTAPAEGGRPGPIFTLQRIAYYVGALHLSGDCRPADPAPMPLTAEKTLGLNPVQLASVIQTAGTEYGAIRDLFAEVADSIGNVAEMADAVQQQLVEAMDQTLMDQLQDQSRPAASLFTIAQQHVEIEVAGGDIATAYLSDDKGHRLLSYTFHPSRHTAADVIDALGLEAVTPQERADLDSYLRMLAA